MSNPQILPFSPSAGYLREPLFERSFVHVVFACMGYAELMGIESLSAWLRRAGHRVSLVHDPRLFANGFDLELPALARMLEQREAFVTRVLELRSDLVGFSWVTATWGWARGIASRLRERGAAPVIVGGAHASALPERWLLEPAIDFVCQGEGEEALLELVQDLQGGGSGLGIANIWARDPGVVVPPPAIRPLLEPLDRLPLPDKELFREVLAPRGVYGLMTARGCPHRCTYCFNSNLDTLPSQGIAPRVRRRSVGHVLEERRWARGRFDFRCVEFHDDDFRLDGGCLFRFLPAYHREIHEPWKALSQARFLDRERIRLKVRTGCRRVKLGIQCLEQGDWKAQVLAWPEEEEDIAAANDLCRADGLRIEEEYFLEHTPDRIATYWLAHLPGTELTRCYLEAGLLDDVAWRAIQDGEVVGYHRGARSFQAWVIAGAGAHDRAIAGLERAHSLRDPGKTRILVRLALGPENHGSAELVARQARALGVDTLHVTWLSFVTEAESSSLGPGSLGMHDEVSPA